MTFEQGIAVAFIGQTSALIFAAFVFSTAWGRAQQRLIDMSTDLKDIKERLLRVERRVNH